MATFEYKAKDKKGLIVLDVIEAGNRKEAAAILRDHGLQVLTLREATTSQTVLDRLRKVSVIEKAVLCRYLATMMKAGLPLSEAVEIIAKESSNQKLHKILRDLQYSLQRGQKLSAVFGKYPDTFDSVFLTLVRAGEDSGTLEQSFGYLSKQLMKSYELAQKVKGALLYPAVIISAMIGVGIIMITFVLPRISTVFLRLNIKLPMLTRIILEVSTFLGKHSLFVIGGATVGMAFVIVLLRLSKTRTVLTHLASKLPVLSRLFDQLDLARFSRTLSTLLKSGVPIIESVRVSIDVLTQRKFTALGLTFEDQMQKGSSLSDAIAKGKKTFPALVTQSIQAGEKSGSLEMVLEELADFYESEVEHTLKSLSSILEPVLMLIIGIAVGAMVIAIIAPIYSIIGSLQPQGGVR